MKRAARTVEAADRLVTAALGAAAPWPAEADAALVLERARYHGVAGLLTGSAAHLTDWPADLRAALKSEAVALAMWEMRHRAIIGRCLADMAAAGIPALLLKGTAVAYRHYSVPATRARGDSDILVPLASMAQARAILGTHGFAPPPSGGAPRVVERQESWCHTTEAGGAHVVDLHHDVFSSPALQPILTIRRAMAEAVPLPGLAATARALPVPLALLHACVHRAQHVISPYFVDHREYYGGDRVIWLKDIDLMLADMDAGAQAAFIAEARRAGVGTICAEGLSRAEALLQTPLPRGMVETLRAIPDGPASRYLTRDRKAGRVLEDLRAVTGGAARLRYAKARLFPPAPEMRARYPDMADRPLWRLHLRRMAGLWTRRAQRRT